LPQEIIIVDDASLDETVPLANRLANVYSNIRLISRSTNGGAADARRDGFRAAECDYVAFVDADDYLEDGALEEAYNTLVDTASDMCILQLWRLHNDRDFEYIDLSTGECQVLRPSHVLSRVNRRLDSSVARSIQRSMSSFMVS
jgi:glycosyltransferase involved in cell wall biosynthesis